MTQEELDALMAGNLEDIEDMDDNNQQIDEEIYGPPADDKHKVVAQLDEVTKESEEKTTEILEKMDKISSVISENIEKTEAMINFLNQQKELFNKLHSSFPHIKKFEDEIKKIDKMIEIAIDIKEKNEDIESEIFSVMDIMQYQDIHRQKIERVVNIMRALIKYMNRLFEGKIDDEKRVKSATHIYGDENETMVSEDEIEKFIEEFGVKQ